MPDPENYIKDVTEGLVSSPGWDEFLKVVGKEAGMLRARLMTQSAGSIEQLALDTSANRGGLMALLAVVKATYKQAGIDASDIPDEVKRLITH